MLRDVFRDFEGDGERLGLSEISCEDERDRERFGRGQTPAFAQGKKTLKSKDGTRTHAETHTWRTDTQPHETRQEEQRKEEQNEKIKTKLRKSTLANGQRA